MADAEKHRTGREIVGLVGPQIAQEKTGDFFLLDITHLIYDGVGKEFDLIVLLGTIEHDLGGTKGFAAVNDRDLRGKAREKKGFFHGRVAAADDGDLFAGEEKTVAGGARRDAVTDQSLFARQPEPACRGAAGDDQSFRLHGFLAEVHGEWALAQVGLRKMPGAD